MSTYDDASLILYPSGYKEDKLYSLKPTDGSGDLDFTRASTATRVNSDGLIEGVRTNANKNFASWTKINGTEVLTSGVIDPFNETNAYNLSGISAGNFNYGIKIVTSLAVAANSYFTISIYAKGTGTIGITAQGTGFFNLLPITLTSTWTRHSLTVLAGSSISSFTFYVSNYTGSTATSVDISFPQAELGTSATDYIPTTSTAVSVGMLANIPRIDYTGGGCGKLLLEPQRTNIALRSQELNNTIWTTEASSATVTANAITSKWGVVDADKIVASVSGGVTHYIRQASISVTANIYTFSILAKADEWDTIELRGTNFWASNPIGIFDLSNGIVLSNLFANASIEDWGDGWYLCIVTATTNPVVGGNGKFQISIGNGGALSLAGDGTSGVFVSDAQLELGNYVTSRIVTLGTAVTRTQDSASKTGISSLINSTEGTMLLEMRYEAQQTSRFVISDGTSNNWIFFSYPESNNQTRVRIAASGVVAVNETSGAVFTANQNYKIALAYKSGSWALYINGTSVLSGAQTFTFNGTLSVFLLSGGFSPGLPEGVYGKISQALLFKTRLTNAELSALTTL